MGVTGCKRIGTADFAFTATSKLAIDVCFAPTFPGTTQFLCTNQTSQALLDQKFLLRIGGLALAGQPGGLNDTLRKYLTFTWVADDGSPAHYIASYPLTSTSPQTAHVELDMADTSTVKMAYYSSSAPGDGFVIETVARWESSPTSTTENAVSNPIVDGANFDGERQFQGVLYWRAIRDRWATDTNVNLMLGKTNAGILRSTVRYNKSEIKHYCLFRTSASPNVDQVTGDSGTLTGTTASDPAGVEMMTIATPTLVKDAHLAQATPGNNLGANTTVVIARGGSANQARRYICDFGNLISDSGIPANATISSATLTMTATASTGSGGTLTCAPIDPVTDAPNWTAEGTGTTGTPTSNPSPGPSWDNADNTAPTAWSAGGVGVSASGNTIGLTMLDNPATGAVVWDITTTIAWVVANGGVCKLRFNLDTDTAGTGARNNTFHSKEGTTPPVLSITYTVPAGGGKLNLLLDI